MDLIVGTLNGPWLKLALFTTWVTTCNVAVVEHMWKLWANG
jgi:hypothetical protein